MFTLSAYACFILLLVFIPSNGCLAPLFPVRSAGDAPSWVERDGGTEANRGEFVSLERKVNTRMARRRIPQGPQLNRVLARAHELAEQVRETAERVHQEAKEAHRLTELARQSIHTRPLGSRSCMMAHSAWRKDLLDPSQHRLRWKRLRQVRLSGAIKLNDPVGAARYH